MTDLCSHLTDLQQQTEAGQQCFSVDLASTPIHEQPGGYLASVCKHKNQGVFVKHYAPGGNKSLKKLFLA